MSLFRERRGLFFCHDLDWKGLGSIYRLVSSYPLRRGRCVFDICVSPSPRATRIQSWELHPTDLRSHLQMLWLDYVSTQTVNTVKFGDWTGSSLEDRLCSNHCASGSSLCFNQTKMCTVPIFSIFSASSYFPDQLEVFPLPLSLSPSFSSLPQWLRTHIWFCFQSLPEPCVHSLSLMETLSSGLDLSQETQNSKRKSAVFVLLPFLLLPLLN